MDALEAVSNKKNIKCFVGFATVVTTIFVLLAVIASAATNEDQTMISDLTIYLAEPILSDGGTVVVIPQEVEVTEWKKESGLQNPAMEDGILATARPIGDKDRRLSVIVSSTINVVRFNFPRDGNFKFAFAPLDRKNASNMSGKTKLVRHGEGTDYDPVSGEDVKVPRIMVVHVLGSKISEDDTLDADNRIKFVALESHYKCTQFEQAVACDATEASK